MDACDELGEKTCVSFLVFAVFNLLFVQLEKNTIFTSTTGKPFLVLTLQCTFFLNYCGSGNEPSM